MFMGCLNPKKGKYLIGKCESYVDAELVRSKLVNEYGFNDDNILNHPQNLNPNANDQDYLSKYGAKILGSYVGTAEYKRSMLQKYFMEELFADMQKLIAHPDLQERYVLFRYSFVKKPLHLFRTISPVFTNEFIDHWVSLKKLVLCSIVGCEVDHWSQLHDEVAQFSVDDGGLGVENHRITRYSAYVASLIDYQKRCQKLIPVNTDLTSVSDASFLGHFIFACKFFMNDEDELTASINNFLKMERKAGSSIQHQLTKIKYITF